MNPLADAILDELRQATTPAQVHSIAGKRRADVMAMKSTDAARYYQVANLKGYLLWLFGEKDTPKYLEVKR